METQELKKAVKELYYWQHEGTSFSSVLYTLIAKAQSDMGNLAKIIKGFPEYVEAYTLWTLAPSPEIFYKQYCPEVLAGHNKHLCTESNFNQTEKNNG